MDSLVSAMGSPMMLELYHFDWFADIGLSANPCSKQLGLTVTLATFALISAMPNRSDTKSPYSEGLLGKTLRVISIVYGIAFHESGALCEGAFFQAFFGGDLLHSRLVAAFRVVHPYSESVRD
jgi:hypothetical protein